MTADEAELWRLLGLVTTAARNWVDLLKKTGMLAHDVTDFANTIETGCTRLETLVKETIK